MEKGFEKWPYPCNEYGGIQITGQNYMGLIMDIDDNKVEIQRILFEDNIFCEKTWIINILININEFKYGFEKRMEKEINLNLYLKRY